MSFEEFRESLQREVHPPAALGSALAALWLEARGEWDSAHAAAQKEPGRSGAWVHAYLHRKEGDLGNAGYWYARAGRTIPDVNVELKTEWEQIVRALLG
jgi:hypothetical protein